jgi:hypothetical protein
MLDLRVTSISFTAAPAAARRTGMLGWASFTIQPGLRVDGVAVRRSARERRLVLSFPARFDRNGVEHAIVRPLNDAVRRVLEAQVLGALAEVV